VLAGCSGTGAPAEEDLPATTAPPPATAALPEGSIGPEEPMPSFDVTSVAGSLVEGFPAAVVPVPPQAQVLASSATDVEGGVLRQVTLNLSSPAAVQEILDFYTGSMTGAGFVSLPGSVAGGLSGQVAFNRATPEGATETLFVGVLDTSDARLVTISGQVVPPA